MNLYHVFELVMLQLRQKIQKIKLAAIFLYKKALISYLIEDKKHKNIKVKRMITRQEKQDISIGTSRHGHRQINIFFI